jgi:N-acetylneuraminate synthase
MIESVQIAGRSIGAGNPCMIVAEIGINHNGDVHLAKKLISAAVLANADAVKFQKRTVDVVYSAAELAKPRESPFGTTNGDLKRGLEFGLEEYRSIDQYCREHEILWFASAWDEASVDFLEQFDPACYKIASANLTDDGLLRHHRRTGKPLIVSTGMSSIDEIDHAVEIIGTNDLILMHTTSTYPCVLTELNLKAIPMLMERYGVPVGYSGHEVGLATSIATVALGACMIERHITLDRAMWGSDQAASVEPHGFAHLVRDVRNIEIAMGDGVKKVYDSERPIIQKLRRLTSNSLQQA